MAACTKKLLKKDAHGRLNRIMFDQRPTDNALVLHLGRLGLNTTRPYSCEHFLRFPKQDLAETVALFLQREGYRTVLYPLPVNGRWLLQATGRMPLTVKGIGGARGFMEGVASRFFGDYDGWRFLDIQ